MRRLPLRRLPLRRSPQQRLQQRSPSVLRVLSTLRQHLLWRRRHRLWRHPWPQRPRPPASCPRPHRRLPRQGPRTDLSSGARHETCCARRGRSWPPSSSRPRSSVWSCIRCRPWNARRRGGSVLSSCMVQGRIRGVERGASPSRMRGKGPSLTPRGPITVGARSLLGRADRLDRRRGGAAPGDHPKTPHARRESATRAPAARSRFHRLVRGGPVRGDPRPRRSGPRPRRPSSADLRRHGQSDTGAEVVHHVCRGDS